MRRQLCLTGLAAVVLLFRSTPLYSQEDAKKTATLSVTLPSNAKLLIDGVETKQTGELRRFETPPLSAGEYEYTLKATWILYGRVYNNTRKVTMRPGQETAADLKTGYDDSTVQVIFVPTPQEVVDKMLELANVTKNDTIYDLGCGDGRIIVTAAKKFGARGVGVDLDPERIKDSQANVKKEGVEKLVEIRQGDALKVADISKATVVTLYMLPEFNKRLQPILQKELKPGTRVVAHDYGIGDWKPLKTERVKGPNREHIVHFWVVEEPKKGD